MLPELPRLDARRAGSDEATGAGRTLLRAGTAHRATAAAQPDAPGAVVGRAGLRRWAGTDIAGVASGAAGSAESRGRTTVVPPEPGSPARAGAPARPKLRPALHCQPPQRLLAGPGSPPCPREESAVLITFVVAYLASSPSPSACWPPAACTTPSDYMVAGRSPAAVHERRHGLRDMVRRRDGARRSRPPSPRTASPASPATPSAPAVCLVLAALLFARLFYRMNLLTIGDFYKQRYGKPCGGADERGHHCSATWAGPRRK